MDFLPATVVVGIAIFYTERLGICLVLLFLACFYMRLSDNLQLQNYKY